jgi:urease accessory protein
MTALPPSSPPPEGLALLTLTQWLSPAFPTGGYAHSHGLEQAMAAGDVHDADTARVWVADVLEHGAGWTDAVLLAESLRPGADHPLLADHARALAGSDARLRETLALGAAFTRGVNGLTGLSRADWPFPVALGAAAQGLGLPPTTVIALTLQAFATNLCTIAIRIVPLGQGAGHRALAGLAPLILRLAGQAATATLADLRSAAFRAEMAAAWHEDLQPRLFRT